MLNQTIINKYEYKFRRINFVLSLILSSIFAFAIIGIVIATINENIQRQRINFMFQKKSDTFQNSPNNDQSLLIQKGTAKGFVQKIDNKIYNFKSLFENASLSFLNQSSKNQDTLLDFTNAHFDITIKNYLQQDETNITADFVNANINIDKNLLNASSGIDILFAKNNFLAKVKSLTLEIENSILKITEEKNKQSNIFLQKDLNTANFNSNTFKVKLKQNLISSNLNTDFKIELKNNNKQLKTISGNFDDGFYMSQFLSILKNQKNNEAQENQGISEIANNLKNKISGYVLEGFLANINITENNKGSENINTKIKSDNIILKMFEQNNEINLYAINKVDIKYKKQENNSLSATCDFAEYNTNKQDNIDFIRLRSNVVMNIKNNQQNINAVCGDAKYDILQNQMLLTNKVYVAGLTDKGSFYIDGLKYNLNEGLMTTLSNNQLENENNTAINSSKIKDGIVLKNGIIFNVFAKYLQNTDIFKYQDNKGNGNNTVDFNLKTPFFAKNNESKKTQTKDNNTTSQRIENNKNSRHKIHININNASD